MIRSNTSAPGKIMLCGEYVVLDGAPSVCMAVNRRANVVIKDSSSDQHVVRCPGFAEGEFKFSVGKNREFEWLASETPLPDFSLLEEVWTAANTDISGSVEIVLDTTPFVEASSGNKVGLGGSAALTVALSAAISGLARKKIDVGAMIETHRRFQGGRGSGADVAVACSGGVIEYRRGETVKIHPLQWQGDLEYAVLWSGQSASTVQKLSHFEAAKMSDGSRQALYAASAEIANAWAEADAEQLLVLFDRYTKTLIDFSDDHGLGVFEAGHAELVELAGMHDVIYKPCGAGGGDVGIVLSSDKDAVDRFTVEAAARGFAPLDVRIDDNGLLIGDE